MTFRKHEGGAPAHGLGSGRLWIVAAPLGNAADLSTRAREVLATADVILAEDTRSARRLLGDEGIALGDRVLLSCFDANEGARAGDVVRRIAAGAQVALLSEAGTPLVSDPGFRVVKAVIDAGLRVQPVPGPSALLAALVGSGQSPDRFVFLGFPPRKKGARRRFFQSVRSLPFTLVVYESPLRTGETLADMAETLGADRPACLARELTKTHEEFVRETLGELARRYRDERPLGEVTLVVAGVAKGAGQTQDDTWEQRAAALLAEGGSPRDTADEIAAASGRPRREIYAMVVALASNGDQDPSGDD